MLISENDAGAIDRELGVGARQFRGYTDRSTNQWVPAASVALRWYVERVRRLTNPPSISGAGESSPRSAEAVAQDVWMHGMIAGCLVEVAPEDGLYHLTPEQIDLLLRWHDETRHQQHLADEIAAEQNDDRMTLQKLSRRVGPALDVLHWRMWERGLIR